MTGFFKKLLHYDAPSVGYVAICEGNFWQDTQKSGNDTLRVWIVTIKEKLNFLRIHLGIEFVLLHAFIMHVTS